MIHIDKKGFPHVSGNLNLVLFREDLHYSLSEAEKKHSSKFGYAALKRYQWYLDECFRLIKEAQSNPQSQQELLLVGSASSENLQELIARQEKGEILITGLNRSGYGYNYKEFATWGDKLRSFFSPNYKPRTAGESLEVTDETLRELVEDKEAYNKWYALPLIARSELIEKKVWVEVPDFGAQCGDRNESHTAQRLFYKNKWVWILGIDHYLIKEGVVVGRTSAARKYKADESPQLQMMVVVEVL